MKTGVLLSGCGVYDGAEVQESVLALLALSQNNMEYLCIAPNINQHHVVNHINGKEISQSRNVMHEAARISRGQITSIKELNKDSLSSIVIPGGFGSAKNLSSWAFDGPDSEVIPEVKDLILHCIEFKKPIVALCISPTLIAKSLEGTDKNPKLTLGSVNSKSEYNIAEIHKAIERIGAKSLDKLINEICVDEDLKIISAPCYMMEGSIDEIYLNIKNAIDKLLFFLNK